MKYTVLFRCEEYLEVTVEAENLDDAEQLALENFDSFTLLPEYSVCETESITDANGNVTVLNRK